MLMLELLKVIDALQWRTYIVHFISTSESTTLMTTYHVGKLRPVSCTKTIDTTVSLCEHN